MKKIFVLIVACLALISCSSVPDGVERTSEGNFYIYKDSVNDSSYYQHKNLKAENIPSWNYFETLSANFSKDYFSLKVTYIHQNWLFVNEITLLDDKGNKMSFGMKKYYDTVLSGGVTVEKLSRVIIGKELEEFENFLKTSGDFKIFYRGSKGRDSFKVPAKVKAGLLESVQKYKEIKE